MPPNSRRFANGCGATCDREIAQSAKADAKEKREVKVMPARESEYVLDQNRV
jgi:hypothetical protein